MNNKSMQLYKEDGSITYVNDFETVVIKLEDIESISNVKNGVRIKFRNRNPFVMNDASLILENCIFENMEIKFFK